MRGHRIKADLEILLAARGIVCSQDGVRHGAAAQRNVLHRRKGAVFILIATGMECNHYFPSPLIFLLP